MSACSSVAGRPGGTFLPRVLRSAATRVAVRAG